MMDPYEGGSQRYKDEYDRPYVNIGKLTDSARRQSNSNTSSCSPQPLSFIDLKKFDSSNDAIDARKFMSSAVYENMKPSGKFTTLLNATRRSSADYYPNPLQEYMMMSPSSDSSAPYLHRKRVSTVSGVEGRSYRDEFAQPLSTITHPRRYSDCVESKREGRLTSDGYLNMTIGKAIHSSRLAPPANVMSRISPEVNYVKNSKIERQPFENLIQHQHHLSTSRLSQRSSLSSDEEHAPTPPIVPTPPTSKPGLLSRFIRRSSSKKTATVSSVICSNEPSILASVAECRKERKSNVYHSIVSFNNSSSHSKSKSNEKSMPPKKRTPRKKKPITDRQSDFMSMLHPVPTSTRIETRGTMGPPLPRHVPAPPEARNGTYVYMSPGSVSRNAAPSRSHQTNTPASLNTNFEHIWSRTLEHRHIHKSGGQLLRSKSITSSHFDAYSGVRIINDSDELRVIGDEASYGPQRSRRRSRSNSIRSISVIEENCSKSSSKMECTDMDTQVSPEDDQSSDVDIIAIDQEPLIAPSRIEREPEPPKDTPSEM